MQWGLKHGLVFGGLIATLALLGGLAGGAKGRTTLGTPLGSLLVWDVAVGVVAGVLAGLGRPLLRTGWGAATIGAVVGAGAFAALVRFGGRAGEPETPVAGDILAIGAAAGAIMGWWMQQREAVRHAQSKRDA